MSARRIIDISQAVDADVGVWPGDTPFSFDFAWSLAAGDSCNVSRITTSPHNGTHADAPLHFLADGASIGEVDLHRYLGPCVVVDGPRQGTIDVAHLASIDVTVTPRVLVRTRDDDSRDFPSDFVSFAPEAAQWLVDRGALLLGLDTPSVDRVDSKELPTHHTLLPARMAILENLRLSHVEPGTYELIALPLRWMGLDASPVRAVLRTL